MEKCVKFVTVNNLTYFSYVAKLFDHDELPIYYSVNLVLQYLKQCLLFFMYVVCIKFGLDRLYPFISKNDIYKEVAQPAVIF